MTGFLKKAVKIMIFTSVIIFPACTLSAQVLDNEQSIAAEEFFQLISTDIDQAYNSTAPEFRAVSSLEDFQSFIDSYPETLDIQDVSFNKMEKEGDFATLEGEITYSEGWGESIKVYLYQSDMWRVGGFEMGN